ncbi:GNAT family N-acetyltransferase [Heyndrickxia ginsengihumi]|uniref:GNAT family N-acetyltransferase n=1 Tax=Heyndrickxia ginsengihumi TaxID=363870 RepID=UPI0004B6802A|nr:GNAT family N-acetyltransferase [Heyndrickxia ginsengihumi]MCM3024009.1 N-acetyltransferase family protein [Heyndrickxia ginsengihumi]
MELKIRDAQIDDLPAMLEIYNDAVRNLTATFDLEEQTLENRREWFFSHGGRYPLIVAESEGNVVGYCSLSKYREKEAYINSAELSVYISKDFRRNGLGTIFLKEIIKRAKELKYHTIISGITDGNSGSIALHEKFGFHYIGCFREVGYKFNQWQDVHFYQLLLEDTKRSIE